MTASPEDRRFSLKSSLIPISRAGDPTRLHAAAGQLAFVMDKPKQRHEKIIMPPMKAADLLEIHRETRKALNRPEDLSEEMRAIKGLTEKHLKFKDVNP